MTIAPMHIAYLCDEYPPVDTGGVGAFVQTLGRALVTRGHRVTVVGCYHGDDDRHEDDRGVRVIRLARTRVPRAGTWINGRRIRRALDRVNRESPIDVLEAPGSGLVLVSPRFPAVKVIRMHGGHRFFALAVGRRPRPFRAWVETRSTARADRFCAVSRYVAEENRALLGLGDTPIDVIHNPVDTHVFRPRPDVERVRGRMVFLGTIAVKKGVRELLRAVPAVLDAVPGAHLWLVGRDWRDPETGASLRRTLELEIDPRLRDRIEFRGEVEHATLPSLLATAEVLVYPSLMEAMPVAWIEGMAMGACVVASSLGPGPEVIDHGVDGLLADPRDAAALADALTTALTDPALRARLGAAARERAEQRYAIQHLVGRNEAFYTACIAEGAAV